MELGWSNAIQAIIMMISTWYIRRGGKSDAQGVKNSTAAQTTSTEILERVRTLEVKVDVILELTRESVGIDHRGPSIKPVE